MAMKKTQGLLVLAMMAAAATLTACSHAMMMIHGTGARRPAAHEFGLGPRTSAAGRCVAMLGAAGPLPDLSAVSSSAAPAGDVLDHYNRAPAAATGHGELRPLRLKAPELSQLETFLRTSSGPIVVNGHPPLRPTQ